MSGLLETLLIIYVPMSFGYLLGRIDLLPKKKKKWEILGEDFLRAEKLKYPHLKVWDSYRSVLLVKAFNRPSVGESPPEDEMRFKTLTSRCQEKKRAPYILSLKGEVFRRIRIKNRIRHE